MRERYLPGCGVLTCWWFGVPDEPPVRDRMRLFELRRGANASVKRWIDWFVRDHPELQFVDQIEEHHLHEHRTFSRVTRNNVRKLLAEHALTLPPGGKRNA